ncbi:hypothetical protein RFI_32101 [Reticulomyxa filosa]|uniref:Uncharacterized protein n=1 Tax=Reticulomyxa filosa TaxID=46433 RepID=X6LX32_RETFI|nr:hypothetical protein RFI_32101 [Reticulomyxa filosa]|eukprot:ETO05295.1 hypothetical protein RFI_32101 [Reticulomyxa filosa]
MNVFDNTKDHKDVLNAIRKTIFDYEYPFPNTCKLFSWILVILLWLGCAAIVIIKGLQFDLQHEADEEKLGKKYPCGHINAQYNIATEIANQLAAQFNFNDNHHSDNISDGRPGRNNDIFVWLISVGVSLLWSVFVWQPLTILFLTALRVWAFRHGLVLEASVKNLCAWIGFSCCGCKNCAQNHLTRKVVDLNDTEHGFQQGTDFVAALAVSDRVVDKHLFLSKFDWLIASEENASEHLAGQSAIGQLNFATIKTEDNKESEKSTEHEEYKSLLFSFFLLSQILKKSLKSFSFLPLILIQQMLTQSEKLNYNLTIFCPDCLWKTFTGAIASITVKKIQIQSYFISTFLKILQ